MKLYRVLGEGGRPRPRVLDADGQARDLSARIDDLHLDRLAQELLPRLDLGALPLVSRDEPPLCPLPAVPRIIGVAGNYRVPGQPDPDAEALPLLFAKSHTALAGPDGVLTVEPGSQLDFEAELGVVIGRGGVDLGREQAARCVLGYVLANDVSERSLQGDGRQWFRAKSRDGFCPVGPWLVLATSLDPADGLRIRATVNDERFQDASTADMRQDVPSLVSAISRVTRLQPGDLILTGSPPGFGASRVPPRYLRDGDRVRLSIAGLGTQSLEIRAASRRSP